MLGTLKRAGTVLDLFTTDEPEWGVTATAHRLGIGKSLAHDILSSLAAIGLLQRVGHGRLVIAVPADEAAHDLEVFGEPASGHDHRRAVGVAGDVVAERLLGERAEDDR